jgi:hypothetical protein
MHMGSYASKQERDTSVAISWPYREVLEDRRVDDEMMRPGRVHMFIRIGG